MYSHCSSGLSMVQRTLTQLAENSLRRKNGEEEKEIDPDRGEETDQIDRKSENDDSTILPSLDHSFPPRFFSLIDSIRGREYAKRTYELVKEIREEVSTGPKGMGTENTVEIEQDDYDSTEPEQTWQDHDQTTPTLPDVLLIILDDSTTEHDNAVYETQPFCLSSSAWSHLLTSCPSQVLVFLTSAVQIEKSWSKARVLAGGRGYELPEHPVLPSDTPILLPGSITPVAVILAQAGSPVVSQMFIKMLQVLSAMSDLSIDRHVLPLKPFKTRWEDLSKQPTLLARAESYRAVCNPLDESENQACKHVAVALGSPLLMRLVGLRALGDTPLQMTYPFLELESDPCFLAWKSLVGECKKRQGGHIVSPAEPVGKGKDWRGRDVGSVGVVTASNRTNASSSSSSSSSDSTSLPLPSCYTICKSPYLPLHNPDPSPQPSLQRNGYWNFGNRDDPRASAPVAPKESLGQWAYLKGNTHFTQRDILVGPEWRKEWAMYGPMVLGYLVSMYPDFNDHPLNTLEWKNEPLHLLPKQCVSSSNAQGFRSDVTKEQALQLVQQIGGGKGDYIVVMVAAPRWAQMDGSDTCDGESDDEKVDHNPSSPSGFFGLIAHFSDGRPSIHIHNTLSSARQAFGSIDCLDLAWTNPTTKDHKGIRIGQALRALATGRNRLPQGEVYESDLPYTFSMLQSFRSLGFSIDLRETRPLLYAHQDDSGGMEVPCHRGEDGGKSELGKLIDGKLGEGSCVREGWTALKNASDIDTSAGLAPIPLRNTLMRLSSSSVELSTGVNVLETLQEYQKRVMNWSKVSHGSRIPQAPFSLLKVDGTTVETIPIQTDDASSVQPCPLLSSLYSTTGGRRKEDWLVSYQLGPLPASIASGATSSAESVPLTQASLLSLADQISHGLQEWCEASDKFAHQVYVQEGDMEVSKEVIKVARGIFDAPITPAVLQSQFDYFTSQSMQYMEYYRSVIELADSYSKATNPLPEPKPTIEFGNVFEPLKPPSKEELSQRETLRVQRLQSVYDRVQQLASTRPSVSSILSRIPVESWIPSQVAELSYMAQGLLGQAGWSWAYRDNMTSPLAEKLQGEMKQRETQLEKWKIVGKKALRGNQKQQSSPTSTSFHRRSTRFSIAHTRLSILYESTLSHSDSILCLLGLFLRSEMIPPFERDRRLAMLHTQDSAALASKSAYRPGIYLTRKYSKGTLKRLLEESHGEAMKLRQAKVKKDAWFFNETEVQKWMTKFLEAQQSSNLGRLIASSDDRSSSNTAAAPHAHELPSLYHIRPLQWYGCRVRSIATGRVTKRASQWQHLTEDDVRIRREGPAANSEYWTLMSFAILDGQMRAFPFLLEWHEGEGNHGGGISPGGWIYTFGSVAGSSETGPDMCIGSFTNQRGTCVVSIDMTVLQHAVPSFLTTYIPHGQFSDAPGRWYVDRREEGPLTMSAMLHSNIESKVYQVARNVRDPPKKNATKEDVERLAEEQPQFAHWRSMIQAQLDVLTPIQRLQLELEQSICAAIRALPRLETFLYTENQSMDVRHQLTIRALTHSSIEKNNSVLVSSASEPPIGAAALVSSSGTSSVWPHASIVWGSPSDRPLPNVLERIIAEYALDEFELVDLPLLESDDSPIEDVLAPIDLSHNVGFRLSELVFGEPAGTDVYSEGMWREEDNP